VVDVYRP